jgi:hypothetical protein
MLLFLLRRDEIGDMNDIGEKRLFHLVGSIFVSVLSIVLFDRKKFIFCQL